MKIEKINENQIRCTLTREDLDQRQLKLSELAYGTEKAKELFREMMQQASYEFGFEAEDIPLMIEAIPVSSESVILIVTKVEYPEELDTRFSRFSEEHNVEELESGLEPDKTPSSANDIIDLFKKAKQAFDNVQDGTPVPNERQSEVAIDITKLFVFPSLENVMRASRIISAIYSGNNTLYKGTDQKFYLVLSKGEHTPEEFNKTCNILTEYGVAGDFSIGSEQYMMEHYKTLVNQNAIQFISQI